MRRGVTLPEVLVVLALVSVVFGIGIPRLAAPLDTLAAERAAADLVAAHARARMTAILQSRVVLLTIGADSLIIAVVTPTDTQQVWGAPGPAANGVIVVGITRRLIFSPVGLTMGFSNARWVLTKGNARREVVMSRLGRIRVVRKRNRGPPRIGRSGRHRVDGPGGGRARGSARPRVVFRSAACPVESVGALAAPHGHGLEAVAADLVEEGGAGNTQKDGCLPLVATGMGERCGDVPALGVCQGIRRHDAVGSERAPECAHFEPRQRQIHEHRFQARHTEGLGGLATAPDRNRTMPGAAQQAAQLGPARGIRLHHQYVQRLHGKQATAPVPQGKTR